MITPSINYPQPSTIQLSLEKLSGGGGVDLNQAISRISVPPMLLKCDIEGTEWELFSKADSSEISKFEQIVIEFHGLQFLYLDKIFEEQIAALEKIYSTHAPIFCNSNNFGKFFLIGGRLVPEVLEVTYLSRELHDCAKINNTQHLGKFRNDPKSIAWTTSFDSLR
jgi:hypothetical protein